MTPSVMSCDWIWLNDLVQTLFLELMREDCGGDRRLPLYLRGEIVMSQSSPKKKFALSKDAKEFVPRCDGFFTQPPPFFPLPPPPLPQPMIPPPPQPIPPRLIVRKMTPSPRKRRQQPSPNKRRSRGDGSRGSGSRQHSLSSPSSLSSSWSRRSEKKGSCTYCTRLGVAKSMSETHCLRHPVTNDIICPVLKQDPCPECNFDYVSPHRTSECPHRESPGKRNPTAKA